MNQLEKLLNKLIKMGWKPWGKDVDKIEIPPKEQFDEDRYLFVDVYFPSGFSRYYTQRELVSYNSGLWQFLCENKLVKQSRKERVLNPSFGPEGADCDWNIQSNEYRYRLMESALVPEEELEEFLVGNIIVEG